MLSIELTRVHVRPEQEEALLAAHPAMLEDFPAEEGGRIESETPA